MNIYDIYDADRTLLYSDCEIITGMEAIALIELGCLTPEDIAFVRDVPTKEGLNIINSNTSACLFRLTRKN